MRAGQAGVVHVHEDVLREIKATAKFLGIFPSHLLNAVLVYATSDKQRRVVLKRHVRFFRRFKRYRRAAGKDMRLAKRGGQVLKRLLKAWYLDAQRGYRVVIVRGAWMIWKNALPGLVREGGRDGSPGQ